MWAAAFEGDAAVQQAVLSGKRGAVRWTMWRLWAAALGWNVAMQWAVLLGGGGRGEGAVQLATRLLATALGGWVAMTQSWAAAFWGDAAVRYNGRC